MALLAAKQAEAVKAQDTIADMLNAGFLMIDENGNYTPGPNVKGS